MRGGGNKASDYSDLVTKYSSNPYKLFKSSYCYLITATQRASTSLKRGANVGTYEKKLHYVICTSL